MIVLMFGSTRSRFANSYISVALSAGLLAACGRIGVEPLPAEADGDVGSVLDGSVDDASWAAGDADEADMDAEPGTSADADADVDANAACMMSCQNENGSASCASGSCVTTCAIGYGDCDGNPNNGCETNTTTNAMTCGGCMLGCMNAHGSVSCSAGVCAPTCASGFADCDEDTDNGCETDLNAVTSCGNCTMACANAHGSTRCQAGVCVPTCAAGYANCDGNVQNGCETNINSDPTHCGSCPNACGTNGQVCTNGACQASPCMAGRAECDGNLAQTCEQDTTSSVNHCGFCGNVCSVANGTPRCTASTCQVNSCTSGFGNCDNNASNGCEVTLATSTNHCGACGAACTNAHGSTRCTGSACVPTCGTGFGDCDSSRPNGCETALNSISHCGMCGRTCPANGGTAVCNAGVCGTICNLTGTYALKMSVAGSWPQDSYIRSGSGTFQFWMRLTGTHSGNSLTGTVTECGRFIPPFSARTVSESFSFHYANSVFDGNFLPASAATITLANASPGASMTLPGTAVQMGIDMAIAPWSRNPVTAAWPTAASQIPAANRIDMDGDGNPGVTAEYEDNYDHPRTGGSLFDPRSDNPYVASRVSFSLNGTLNSCTQATGSANFAYIDTRIYACSLDSGTCNGSQASFLDTNCLNYTMGSATYTLVKVANGASCATIRAALP
jgi:hypothetical protein